MSEKVEISAVRGDGINRVDRRRVSRRAEVRRKVDHDGRKELVEEEVARNITVDQLGRTVYGKA